MTKFSIKVYASGGNKYPLELQGETETIDTDEIIAQAKKNKTTIKQELENTYNKLISKWETDHSHMFGSGIEHLRMKQYPKQKLSSIKSKKGVSKPNFIRNYVQAIGGIEKDTSSYREGLNAILKARYKIQIQEKKSFWNNRATEIKTTYFTKPSSFAKFYKLSIEQATPIFNKLRGKK